jgi:hypothetical protein
MRKSRLVFCLLLAAAAAGASTEPTRVGLEIGNPSGAIVIRPAPFDIKIGYDFTGVASREGGDDYLQLSCDYRLMDRYPLTDGLSLYVAAGGYLRILTTTTQDSFVLGGRLPVGLQVFVAGGTVEIFLELVPTVTLLPTIVAFDDWQGFLGFTVPVSALNLKR